MTGHHPARSPSPSPALGERCEQAEELQRVAALVAPLPQLPSWRPVLWRCLRHHLRTPPQRDRRSSKHLSPSASEVGLQMLSPACCVVNSRCLAKTSVRVPHFRLSGCCALRIRFQTCKSGSCNKLAATHRIPNAWLPVHARCPAQEPSGHPTCQRRHLRRGGCEACAPADQQHAGHHQRHDHKSPLRHIPARQRPRCYPSLHSAALAHARASQA